MKTSPNDVSNKEIMQELKKLSVSGSEMKEELKKLSVSSSEMKQELKKLSDKIDNVHVETMEAVYELSKHTDERFDLVDKRFNLVDERFDLVDKRFDRLEGRVGSVESKMVTKGYLDDKISDLRSDMSQYTLRQIEKARG